MEFKIGDVVVKHIAERDKVFVYLFDRHKQKEYIMFIYDGLHESFKPMFWISFKGYPSFDNNFRLKCFKHGLGICKKHRVQFCRETWKRLLHAIDGIDGIL